MQDVLIIGAGVSGCAIARELSKKKLNITVLDKNADVCEGTSKANSGIVHAGFDARPGTLKARLNVRGSRMMEALSRELDFSYRRNGSLVLAFRREDIEKLEELRERGIKNGVEGLRILERKEILSLEPEIGGEVTAALYAPKGAIVCPFGLTIAFAENAAVNGVEFRFETEVLKIGRIQEGYRVFTDRGFFDARTVVNAAGVFADEIHNMICGEEDRIRITPRKGEYLLCDKKAGNLVKHTLFQIPTSLGKGVLVTPTVHGNLLMGPTAEDMEDKEGTATSRRGLERIREKAAFSVRKVPEGAVITSFAGLRAKGETGDFIIEEVKKAPGFFDVAGMESPGLSSAPAVGEYVAQMVCGYLEPADNPDFIAVRKGIPSMALASREERARLIREDPSFANVICRCEMVTEGEILAAIRRPVGAVTTDGIKRRVRAGMGRCQAGFCTPRVLEILAGELGTDISKVRKSQEGSCYLLPDEVFLEENIRKERRDGE